MSDIVNCRRCNSRFHSYLKDKTNQLCGKCDPRFLEIDWKTVPARMKGKMRNDW